MANVNVISMAPLGGAYVTIGSDSTLTAERALTQGTGVTITDAGANSTVTIAIGQSVATGASPTFAGLTLSSPLTVGNGGTGTATAFTAGSVIFAGASGVYSQDNAKLFWDDTNFRLGYRTTAPLTDVNLVHDGAQFIMQLENYTANTNAPKITFLKGRGTYAAPFRTQSGDRLGNFVAQGFYNDIDNTTLATLGTNVAAFAINADENYTSTAQGSKWALQRIPTGSVTLASWLTADNTSPNVGVAGCVTLYPGTAQSGKTSGGRIEFFSGPPGTGGSNYDQVSLRLVSTTGNPPTGNYFTGTTYANPGIFFGVADATTGGNTNNAYCLGSEFSWTQAGGFDQGVGFYIFDNTTSKTAITIGYGTPTGVQIGSTVTGAYDLWVTGKIKQVNSLTTAGLGVDAVMAAARSTAQTAAVASVAAYTVGSADGTFQVSANVLVTTSTTHSFTTTCTYTDEGNTSRTLTLNFSQLAGTLITAITNVTGVGPYEGVPVHIRAKAGTTITIATTGTFTTVTYNVDGLITQAA